MGLREQRGRANVLRSFKLRVSAAHRIPSPMPLNASAALRPDSLVARALVIPIAFAMVAAPNAPLASSPTAICLCDIARHDSRRRR